VNSTSDRTTVLQKYGWEASLISIIGVVIATLALVTNRTPLSGSSVDAAGASKIPVPQPTLGRAPGTTTGQSGKVASQERHRADLPVRRSKPPSDPHEVVIGPNSISGRFRLLSIERKKQTSTSDQLTLRVHVISMAFADLVTPFQSTMVEVNLVGHEPIQPQHPFSHPVAAGTEWNQDIDFSIPSGPTLHGAALRIHYYPEAKDIPLDLPLLINTP